MATRNTSRFDAVAALSLTTARDGKTLPRLRCVKCRENAVHLGNKHRDRFDIKADEGRCADIEFIAQYHQLLRYAHEKPKLTRWSLACASRSFWRKKRHYG